MRPNIIINVWNRESLIALVWCHLLSSSLAFIDATSPRVQLCWEQFHISSMQISMLCSHKQSTYRKYVGCDAVILSSVALARYLKSKLACNRTHSRSHTHVRSRIEISLMVLSSPNSKHTCLWCGKWWGMYWSWIQTWPLGGWIGRSEVMTLDTCWCLLSFVTCCYYFGYLLFYKQNNDSSAIIHP